jgi:hypothetical protein
MVKLFPCRKSFLCSFYLAESGNLKAARILASVEGEEEEEDVQLTELAASLSTRDVPFIFTFYLHIFAHIVKPMDSTFFQKSCYKIPKNVMQTNASK